MTLVVNLFAGPGAGKSTMAYGLTSALKSHKVLAELATEFAKDLVWEKRFTAMDCQPYVFGEQLFRLHRLAAAGVEVAVTDSPLLLSAIYGKTPAGFKDAVRAYHESFNSLNFYLVRNKPYDPRGRRQSEASARGVDSAVRDFLNNAAVPYSVTTGDSTGLSHVLGVVKDTMIANGTWPALAQ